ncbi:MAG: hypothetical protein R2807_04520 [Chitinophagales bacterium]
MRNFFKEKVSNTTNAFIQFTVGMIFNKLKDFFSFSRFQFITSIYFSTLSLLFTVYIFTYGTLVKSKPPNGNLFGK